MKRLFIFVAVIIVALASVTPVYADPPSPYTTFMCDTQNKMVIIEADTLNQLTTIVISKRAESWTFLTCGQPPKQYGKFPECKLIEKTGLYKMINWHDSKARYIDRECRALAKVVKYK